MQVFQDLSIWRIIHLLRVDRLDGDWHDPLMIWQWEPRASPQLETGVSTMISKGVAVDNIAEMIIMSINSNLVGNQAFESIIVPLDNQPFDLELGLFLILKAIPISAVSWIG